MNRRRPLAAVGVRLLRQVLRNGVLGKRFHLSGNNIREFREVRERYCPSPGIPLQMQRGIESGIETSAIRGERQNIMATKKLAGKVAVVTGASKGIGAAIAEHLAAEGAAVVVNYSSSKSGADAVVKRITQKDGRAVSVQADLSKPEDIGRLFAEAKKAFGKLDILVNNAGVYEFAPLEAITPEHFHKQYNLNVLGLVLATQEAVKHMSAAGGSIINISSVAATLAPPSGSLYSGTKAAVNAITISLAKELGPRKIRVNAINPGMVETEGVHAAGIIESDFRKQIEASTPLGRIGQPQDIAPAAVFLASSDAAWITGETLYISGGHR
jgi:3-oxoacyl-[acyl-carrier protein] reductase